jgi:ubiquinone/menaquinone biosynthesis C-methylase UbiE
MAHGRVLEIGVGSGLNIPYYHSTQVDRLWALDPSETALEMAKFTHQDTSLEIEWIEAGAESIPVEDGLFDSIVTTYTLCSLPNLQESFEEFRRVLKPEGQLIFCEHGLAPDKSVYKWQVRLNPLWKRLSGGCNLNRDILSILKKGGFEIRDLETMYLPGWKPATYNMWGKAAAR